MAEGPGKQTGATGLDSKPDAALDALVRLLVAVSAWTSSPTMLLGQS